MESGSWVTFESSPTYQEHNRDIKAKGNHSVSQQCEDTNAVDMVHCHMRHLEEEGCDTVHDRTDGREIVKRHERVHFELSGAQKSLNHDQTDSLEDDATNLEQKADKDELYLSEGSDNDTDDDR